MEEVYTSTASKLIFENLESARGDEQSHGLFIIRCTNTHIAKNKERFLTILG